MGYSLPSANPLPSTDRNMQYKSMVDDDQRHPVGGMDYPGTLRKFDEWFTSEEACAVYLRRVRWSKGFRCPRQSERDHKI